MVGGRMTFRRAILALVYGLILLFVISALSPIILS